MSFIADLHIHSKYSRATAKSLDFENLYIAAQIKGITVIGTGDFTHPAWWEEINAKLTPAEEGLFALKADIAQQCDQHVPPRCRQPVRFMLVTEISNIYKKNGRTRKNHNLVFMPDAEAAQRFNARLAQIGNIESDGRPILGLDARNLLEIVLETSTGGYLIPAHIWTPWFSLLGSKSGFDHVEACFEDLSDHIFALETGLSSDPPMNWRVSDLDPYTLVSNSDAHSPAKLGREANWFDTPLGYTEIRTAMETADPDKFLGTFEFFPEEGKYHLDGHRKCSFRSNPDQTRQLEGQCPVCKKPLTLGVLYRVEELADRPLGIQPAKARPYYNLIPLESILAEVFQTGPQTKRVARAYGQLIDRFGSEFDILRIVSREALDQSGIALLAEAIDRARTNRLYFEPGYDGEFGRVHIFEPTERDTLQGQRCLFAIPSQNQSKGASDAQTQPASRSQTGSPKEPPVRAAEAGELPFRLNDQQQAAVEHGDGPLLIVAGPGTGKTRTITERIGALIATGRAQPAHILAVTFTNKAAQEMRLRLNAMDQDTTGRCTITTFHGLCWQLLNEVGEAHQGAIVDEWERKSILQDAVQLAKDQGHAVNMASEDLLAHIIEAKQLLMNPEDNLAPIATGDVGRQLSRIYGIYQELLSIQNLFDFEDLILKTVQIIETDTHWRRELRKRYTRIFVDEFQDINHGQYRLLRALTKPNADVCVIGDPDQAIYGFRGSDIRFFEQFTSDYPGAHTIGLRRNYRSTETILNASFQVINCRQDDQSIGFRSRTYSQIDGVKTISVLRASTARAEAVVIGQTIEKMVGGTGFHALDFGKVEDVDHGCSFADFAVLVRTADQGQAIAEVLTAAGIPCQLVCKERRQHNRPVAKLLAALRVLIDRGSYADLHHLIDLTAPGISRETLSLFKSWSYAKKLPVQLALHTAMRLPIPGMSATRQQRLVAWIRTLRELKKAYALLPATEVLDRVFQSTTLSVHAQDDDIQKISASIAQSDSSLEVFLASQALEKDTDLYQPYVEKVALMTMHAAKGLEFNVVFVAGCEEGLTPYRRADSSCVDPAEERRLFYVAMTRAKQLLFLSWAAKRTRFGKTTTQYLSPFVADIAMALKENVESQPRKQVQRQLSLF